MQVCANDCKISDVPVRVRVGPECTFRPGELCRMTCKNRNLPIWTKKILCQEDGQWAEIPPCSREIPVITVDAVKCDELSIDDADAEGAFCAKLTIPMPSEEKRCADISQLGFKMGSCSRKPNSYCSLSCQERKFLIKCLPEGTWSEIPACDTADSCPELMFAKLVNCTRKIGESCKVQCPNGVIPLEDAVCLSSGEWSPLPSCRFRDVCARAPLRKPLQFVDPECKTSAARSCEVGCFIRVFVPGAKENALKLVSITESVCTSSGEWRPLPDCEMAKELFWDEAMRNSRCPLPEIDSNAEFQSPCSAADGSECLLRCKDDFFLQGDRVIRCHQGKWIGSAECLKPICPVLPDVFETTEKCWRIKGYECTLRCRKGAIEGKRTIRCLSNGEWDSMPKCVENEKCPLVVSPDISFVANCSFTHEDRCQVICKNYLVLVGSNFITCHLGVWRGIPDCVPAESSPYEKFEMNCKDKPGLSPTLKIFGQCRYDTGMSCQITCRDPLAFMVGPNATTCLPPGTWSSTQYCTGEKTFCTDPELDPSLEPAEDCKRKRPGQKCFLKCKGRSSFVGYDFIICMNDSKWSQAPECAFCSVPKLPTNMVFEEDCSSKVVGDYCKVACANKDKVFGGSVVKCMNSSVWSEFPTCSCPLPEFSDNIVSNSNCSHVIPGKLCLLSCKGNSKIVGNNSIECLPSLEWTPQPKCESKICSEPVLTESLVFKEDCSSKLEGENCQLNCKYGGKFLDRNYTTCINENSWSSLPSCSCAPFRDENLITSEDCSIKRSGETCSVACEHGKSLIGKSTVLCQSNGTWDYEPSCRKKTCITPTLAGTLHFKENCSSKSPSESCEIDCNNDGVLIGKNPIECTSETEWSAMPVCACPEPKLRNNINTKDNCRGKLPGHVCELECINKGTKFKSRNYIICQNNTKWDDDPICEKVICPDPTLPEILGFEYNCSNRVADDICRVKCKRGGKMFGENFIKCIDGASWTSAPDCSCPEPKLKTGLEFKETCSQKRRNETCSLGCQSGLKMLGANNMTCLDNTEWSPQPDCQRISCPNPSLPSFLAFNGSCVSGDTGDTCRLKCTNGGRLVGIDTITCTDGRIWSEKPFCTCPKPVLGQNMQLRENCDRKKPEERCNIGCKKNFYIKGPKFITCHTDGNWRHLSWCEKMTCDLPNLTSTNLVLNESCSNKKVNESCGLKCEKGGSIIGSAFVQCLRKNRSDPYWSRPLPKCSCPIPKLSERLETKENCSLKIPRQRCKIGCKLNYQLNGSDFIACKENTEWSDPPVCYKIKCAKPSLSDAVLEFEENCSVKYAGDTCQLKCKNNSSVIGSGEIKCLPNSGWTEQPKCGCPNLVLRGTLETVENCVLKKRGEWCSVKCKESFELSSAENRILCLPSAQWQPLPSCRKKMCSVSTLSSAILEFRNCESKRVGDTCEVECKRGGEMIGKRRIQCINETTWSPFPDCKCPSPDLGNRQSGSPVSRSKLRFAQNCSSIKRGDKCFLRCEGNFKVIGNSYITCRNDTTWTAQPDCELKKCLQPKISSKTLVFADDCSNKSIGDTCPVKCKEGGRIKGSNVSHSALTCLSETSWSPAPDCACPAPTLGIDIKTKGDCSGKFPGGICELECVKKSTKFKSRDFISCQNDTKWDDNPICENVICPDPTLPDILAFEHNCSNIVANDICRVKCKRGGKMFGENFIKCVDGASWTLAPDCSCPEPELKSGLEFKETCGQKRRNETCNLGCKSGLEMLGANNMTCLDNTEWSVQPDCQRISCPNPSLPSFLAFDGPCVSGDTGDTCRLKCTNLGRLVGIDTITCTDGRIWSEKPFCTCPKPVLLENMELREDCDQKKPLERCNIGCKTNFVMSGRNFLTCLTDGRWGSLFSQCAKMTCDHPNVKETNLVLNESCSNKKINESCGLKCEKGGSIIGSAFIQCLRKDRFETEWSRPLPKCSCPIPKLSERLETKENCSLKIPRQRCKIGCKLNYQLNGSDFITCKDNTEWSDPPVCDKIKCAKPSLSDAVLEFQENCSAKYAGDTCQLKCNKNSSVIGSGKIKCLPNSGWTEQPKCGCPNLVLRGTLETVENCVGKKRGEWCSVKCKERFELSSAGNRILCLPSAQWQPLPACRKKMCSVSSLSSAILDFRNCASKSVGDTCEVECKRGGEMIGKRTIHCINETTWSPFPDCKCPLPDLGNRQSGSPVSQSKLRFAQNCSSVKRGEKCFLTCEGNYKITGDSYITCRNDTTWTAKPECELKKCLQPNISIQTLEFAGDCSNKSVGEDCRVKCKNGGKILGSNSTYSTISCLANRQWSQLPTCTCPSLISTQELEVRENCDSKKPGERCEMRCKAPYKLVGGKNYTFCENNSRWGPQPICQKIRCPVPALPKDKFSFEENCTGKYVGQYCQVKCKHGKLIGTSGMQCLLNTSWTPLPICGCFRPELRKNVALQEECHERKPGEKCRVKCINGLQTNGTDYILCGNDTRWSNQPSCFRKKCPDPSLPSDALKLAPGCSSKTIGQSCNVLCASGGKLFGSSMITCLNNSEWSDFPECGCPKPILDPNLRVIKGQCDSIKPGQKCYVGCKRKMTLKGIDHIICQNNFSWNEQPKCVCGPPKLEHVLPDVVDIPEECSSKTAGETCLFKCKQGGIALGRSFLTCHQNGSWSEFEGCTCGAPYLPRKYFINKNAMRYWFKQDDCKNLPVEANCWLDCADQLRLEGRRNYITCLPNTTWTTLPVCRGALCPPPSMRHKPRYRVFEMYETLEDCSKKEVWEDCPVKCKHGGFMLGTKDLVLNLTCLPNGTWWPKYPGCTCGPFKLGPNMRLNKTANLHCDGLTDDQDCYYECEEGYVPYRIDTGRCEEETTWWFFGGCKKNNGTEPYMCETGANLYDQNVFVGGTCGNKFTGESCLIKCKHGGTFRDGSIWQGLMCMGKRFWRTAQPCLCTPPPPLPNGLEIDVTKNKDCIGFEMNKDSSRCRVRCKPGFREGPMIYGVGGGYNDWRFLLCDYPGEWKLNSDCIYEGYASGYCRQPKLPKSHVLMSACPFGFKDDTCPVSCKSGGKIASHGVLGYISCLGDDVWSSVPPCYCPSPEYAGFLRGGLELDIVQNLHCNEIAANQACYLSCKRGFTMRGSNSITCLENSYWSPRPVCEYSGALTKYCLQPNMSHILERLQSDYFAVTLDVDTDCSFITPGESCHLKCKRGGRFLSGRESIFIQCKDHNEWEKLVGFQGCTCPPPILTRNVIFRRDMNTHCDGIAPGKYCWLTCPPDFTLRGTNYTYCHLDTEWSLLPYCDYNGKLEEYCTSPSIPDVLEFEGECALKGVSENCALKCRRGGKILRNPAEKFVYIHCIKHGRWSALFNFTGCSCPPPKLHGRIVIDASMNADCDFVASGQVCYVKCSGEHHVPSQNFIKCLIDNTWTYQPVCENASSCAKPGLLLGQTFLENKDCSNTKKYKTCTIACFTPSTGHTYVNLTCYGDDVWSTVPKCQCHPPALSSALIDEARNQDSSCSGLPPGSQCWLKCPPGYRFENSDFITCKGDVSLDWDPEPPCLLIPASPTYCQPIPLTQGMRVDETKQQNCDQIAEGQACWLRCDPGYKMRSFDYSVCQNGAWTAIPVCDWVGYS